MLKKEQWVGPDELILLGYEHILGFGEKDSTVSGGIMCMKFF
jgi:hypothetical protein